MSRLIGNLCALLRLCSVVAAVSFCTLASTAQSLRFVPPIYNVPLSSLNLLSSPTQLATDVHGNVYIVDTGHSRIWKVDTTQTTTLFAGNGSASFSGDNGLAVFAAINNPSAVAVDTAGNVFIADANNFAVRRVDAVTGIITTIAGGNGSGYSGDGGLAINAKLTRPSGIAVDGADNIYVADGLAHVVRKIFSNGNISTYAGGGTPSSGNGDGGLAVSAKLTTPAGIALDTNGNLYIADPGAFDVREVAAGSNTISTLAGTTYGNSGMGGPANAAKLEAPNAVAVDAAGTVYITDGATGYTDIVDSTKNINILAGQTYFGSVGDGLPALLVQIVAPQGVAVDQYGNVFVDSNSNNKVYEIVQHPEQFQPTRVGQSSAQQRLIIMNFGTSTITIPSTGVATTGDFAVGSAINANDHKCTTFYGTLTSGNGSNFCSIDIVFTPTAAGIRTGSVTVTSNDTPTTTTIGLTSLGMSPTVAVSGGIVYTIAGIPTPQFITNRQDNVLATNTQIGEIDGLAYNGAGDLYISEYAFSDVRKVDHATDLISFAAGSLTESPGFPLTTTGPATSGTFQGVGDVVVGPDQTLYLSDGLNNMIRTVDTSGNMHVYAGTGNNNCATLNDGMVANTVPVCSATGLAMNAAGDLYFSQSGLNFIRKIDHATGKLSTVAGTSTFTGGYGGDNGPALSATFKYPWNLAVDSKGNIFVADAENFVIRRIDGTTNTITTVAGTPTVQGYSGDGGLATNAKLDVVYGVAIDAADNIYIADSGNNVIRKVDSATGIINTIAGNHVIGDLYNGDGLPATATGIEYPEHLKVDPFGAVIFSDDYGIVRRIDPNGLHDFGDQKLNVASNAGSITISNIGNLPLHFDATTPYTIDGDFTVVSGGTCNFAQALASGASCTVNVVFTPSASYERYGTLNLNDDAIGSPQITELRGNGLVPAVQTPTLTPNPVAFPSQTVNTTSSTQTVTLLNPGATVLNITSIALGGANPTNFAISQQQSTCGATLAAGANCSIVVTFTPSAVTSYSATLTVTDDASPTTQSTTLTGSGIAAPAPLAVLTPPTLTFSSQLTGTTSASQSFTLTNPGTASLTITGITITGTNATSFATAQASTCGSSLAAGASCSIVVTFTPLAAGAVAASVSVADNATGSPQVGAVTGVGTAPADFTVAATPRSATVSSGSSTTYNIALGSLNPDNPFSNAVTLSASGLPTGAMASFAPASGTPGAAGTSSVLTITTVKPVAMTTEPTFGPRAGLVSFAFLVAGAFGLRRRRGLPRLLLLAFTLTLGGLAAAGLTGCGGGFALPAAAPTSTTYTITVTGTSGSVNHSTTVTLTVNN